MSLSEDPSSQMPQPSSELLSTSPTPNYTVQPTEFSDTKRYLGDEFSYTIGTLNLILGLQAVILNTFVIAFYIKKRRETVPLMYLFVSSTDLLTGLSALLVSVIMFLLKTHHPISALLVLPAYAVFSVTFKVSVFLNLTVAVVRTINIVQPFYRVRMKLLVLAIVLYILGWIIFTAVQISRENPDHLRSRTVFDSYLYSPGQYQIVQNTNGDRTTECRNVALFIGLPYLLPSLLVLGCMVVQARELLKYQPNKTAANSTTQRDITLTIFMMTVLFFVCNTAYVVYPVTHCMETLSGHNSHHRTKEELRSTYRLRFLTGVLAPFINAAFNPLILITRGAALKAAILGRSRKLTVNSLLGRPTRISTVLINPYADIRKTAVMSPPPSGSRQSVLVSTSTTSLTLPSASKMGLVTFPTGNTPPAVPSNKNNFSETSA